MCTCNQHLLSSLSNNHCCFYCRLHCVTLFWSDRRAKGSTAENLNIQTWKHKWQDWFLSRLDPELSIKILFNKFKGFGQNNNPISSDVDHGMIWESIVTCIYPVQWFKDCRPLCHVHYVCNCVTGVIVHLYSMDYTVCRKHLAAYFLKDLWCMWNLWSDWQPFMATIYWQYISWYQQFGRSPQFHPFYYLRLQKIMNIVYTDDMSRLVQCPSSCFRE